MTKAVTRADQGNAEMTFERVAQHLGLHVGTVTKTERRAIRKLRKELERQAQANGVSVKEWLLGEGTY